MNKSCFLYFCAYLIILFSVVLYAVSAVYFAGVMVRLMLTLTPVVCVLSGIAFSHLFGLYLKEEENPSTQDSDSETEDGPSERSNRNLYDKVSKCRITNKCRGVPSI